MRAVRRVMAALGCSWRDAARMLDRHLLAVDPLADRRLYQGWLASAERIDGREIEAAAVRMRAARRTHLDFRDVCRGFHRRHSRGRLV